ncbi:hypothetical protein PP301_gp055 [Gordonia phage GMA2]|uniref:Uncharacterized protein n=1 Tax=Gordonia phage GMA2 TaxID=1647283 RepID=A0A0K0N766_9CAUD|nr:hypothetical protein PP301_gp055 [Gordonia phage GMA2]AKJ72593.1 hypothetical protein GMA2_55 [Gordonia phage GMA2]
MTAGPSLVQTLWNELDGITSDALERDDRDSVEYAKLAGLGRGLATAVMIMCTPAFESTDQVIALSVRRVTAKQRGEEAPATPGFMGPGQTMDMMRQAAMTSVSGAGEASTTTADAHSDNKRRRSTRVKEAI